MVDLLPPKGQGHALMFHSTTCCSQPANQPRYSNVCAALHCSQAHMWLHEACQRVPPHMELLFRAKGEAALARCGWYGG